MMKHGLVLAAPALLLCGCDKGVDMKNASASEVADTVKEATADGQFVSPGRWESTMTMIDMSMPGRPQTARLVPVIPACAGMTNFAGHSS